MKEVHIGLGIQNGQFGNPQDAWCLPCCTLPSPPWTPTFPPCLKASVAPGQDCIILGFVCGAAGGGVGPAARHPPSLSSPSTLSRVILLLLPFSGPCTPGIVCLSRGCQLPFHVLLPGDPRRLQATEAKGRRLGAMISTRLETALRHLCSPPS